MRQIRLCDTPEALGKAVAHDLATRIAAKTGPFLLGCPGGRSPRPVYAALAAHRLDLSRLVIVMMDDYLIETQDGFDHVDANAHYSCRRFARDEIQSVLNADLPPARRIPDTSIWFPDPRFPADYDRRISDAGGIDFFLLASGASDGHVAFNPQGSPADSITRIVTLAEQTRRDNLATFPDFASLDEVPRHGGDWNVGLSGGEGVRAVHRHRARPRPHDRSFSDSRMMYSRVRPAMARWGIDG